MGGREEIALLAGDVVFEQRHELARGGAPVGVRRVVQQLVEAVVVVLEQGDVRAVDPRIAKLAEHTAFLAVGVRSKEIADVGEHGARTCVAGVVEDET